jgi:hypothetical protein
MTPEMTPEELKRLMETIERIKANWKAQDEGREPLEERPEVLESRKTMKEVKERLEKLLEHERQKLKESEERLRRHLPPLPPPAG